MTIELTQDTFDEFIGSTDLPVVIDFWAPWCGPCKLLAPIIDELGPEMSNEVLFAKINIDEYPSFVEKFMIATIPALVVLKNGEYVGRVSSAGGFGKHSLTKNVRIAIAGDSN